MLVAVVVLPEDSLKIQFLHGECHNRSYFWLYALSTFINTTKMVVVCYLKMLETLSDGIRTQKNKSNIGLHLILLALKELNLNSAFWI
jgi:hypothetical protein